VLLKHVQMVEDPILQPAVPHGGPLAGRPATAVQVVETDHPVGVQGPVGERFDVCDRKTARAPGGHRLHHLGFPEAGVVAAQTHLGVHQPVEQLAHLQPSDRRSRHRAGTHRMEERHAGG
jgi:hypothetical protein